VSTSQPRVLSCERKETGVQVKHKTWTKLATRPSEDLTTCWQVLESDDLTALSDWSSNGDDRIDFTVVPAITSPRLEPESFKTRGDCY